MTIEFRLLRTRDEGQQFIELHNFLFKNTAASPRWFQWYFDEISSTLNDDSYTRVYGGFDDKKLFGCWCVEPKRLMLPTEQNKFIVDSLQEEKPNIINVGRCFAVGIHNDYQRRGLFIDLSNYAIDEERKLKEYEYILGFPQRGKPVIGGHLKAGWDETSKIEMMSWRSEVLPANPTALASVKRITNFNTVKFELLPGVASFVENETYRNLKWLKHPDHYYICLTTHLEDAYVVLKPYKNACHILDIRGTSSGVILLLAAVKTLAVRHRWEEVTCWCANNEYHALEITSSGFKDGAQFGLPIELLSVRINATTRLKLDGYMHFMQGVEEIY